MIDGKVLHHFYLEPDKKVQWIKMTNGIFSVTEKMTEAEARALYGAHWYRPLVGIDYLHKYPDQCTAVITEINTSLWKENNSRKFHEEE